MKNLLMLVALGTACAVGLALSVEAGCGGCGPEKELVEPEHASLNTAALEVLVQARAPLVILDARGPRATERVPGAQPVAHTLSVEEAARLIPSKQSLVVTYCGGPSCTLSPKLAHRLAGFGYQNVVEYPGGISDWQRASSLPASSSAARPGPKAELNTPALKALISSRLPLVILDARSGKYDDGRRIGPARQLSHDASAEQIAAAVPDKDSLIVTYCGSTKCSLSHKLASRLMQLGYRNVMEYPEGMKGWSQATPEGPTKAKQGCSSEPKTGCSSEPKTGCLSEPKQGCSSKPKTGCSSKKATTCRTGCAEE